MNAEIWKDIPGYEGLYQASSLGRIRSFNGRWKKEGKIMKQYRQYGYFSIRLGRNKKFQSHRLIVTSFLGNIEEGMQVNHKNGVKDDNRVHNLEIVTASQNQIHAYRVLGRKNISGLKGKFGFDNPLHKSIRQITNGGGLVRVWSGSSEAARELGLQQSNISKCCRGETGYRSAGGYIWEFV